MIAGLLLAAGRGRRFGGDKLLAPLHGRPVLAWSASVMAAGVDALYVVLPPDAPERVAALTGISAELVPHAGRDAGIASSIAAGVAALPREAEAVVIALGDQPLADPDVVRRLSARWREAGAAAVVPRYREGRGHPVLFGRGSFDALRRLTGDTGARDVLRSLGDRVAEVAVDAPVPADVDTPEALQRLIETWRG